MADLDSGKIIISEMQVGIEFIKQNWKGTLGEQYICWLEQTQEKLKEMERRREVISLKAEKISVLCQKVMSTDDDQPKTLVLRRR